MEETFTAQLCLVASSDPRWRDAWDGIPRDFAEALVIRGATTQAVWAHLIDDQDLTTAEAEASVREALTELGLFVGCTMEIIEARSRAALVLVEVARKPAARMIESVVRLSGYQVSTDFGAQRKALERAKVD